MSSNQPKILIIDPNEWIALGLEAILKRADAYRVEIAQCTETEDLLNTINLIRPKLLIANPLVTGLRIDTTISNKLEGSILALLYENMKNLPLVGYRQIISIDTPPKEILEIVDAHFHQVAETDEQLSEKALSPREIDVVILVAKGLTNKEIARYLSLSIHTVITHRRNIARKLDIHSVSGITIYAIMNQLVTLEETNMK